MTSPNYTLHPTKKERAYMKHQYDVPGQQYYAVAYAGEWSHRSEATTRDGAGRIINNWKRMKLYPGAKFKVEPNELD